LGPDEYMAMQLMQVKGQTEMMIFLTTFWLGKYVMVSWDNVNSGILHMWGVDDLTEDALLKLESLVWDFMGDYEESA